MDTRITKQQKIEAIMHDFLDRDQDNYVKIRRTNRLGWENLIPEGGNYSDVLRSSRCEDVIKEAYAMARDYIVAMDTPFKVTLRLSDERNCTDSKVVYLMTKMFDDEDITVGQQIDTFIGLAIHEGCHLKYTDFTQKANAGNIMIARLINLIEDERIERLCGEQMPGYANFLKACKYYMFGRYTEKQMESVGEEELPAYYRLFNAILSIIRYPKSIDEKDLDEFADYLYEVREILLDYPQTSRQVTDAAYAIYEIIKSFIEEQQGKPMQGSGSDDGQQQDCDSSSGEKQPENREMKDGAGKRGGAGDGTESEDDDSAEGGSEQSVASNDTDDGRMKQILDEVAKALDEALREIAKSPEESHDPMERKEMSNAVKRDGGMLAGICENMISLGNTGAAVMYKAVDNKEAYMDSLSRVRKYIPAISRALKGHCSEYDVAYRGMRSGKLDTSKIAEAYQGVQNVYVRDCKIKSDKMAVCVLVDESGSMHGNKIDAARDLAVLLHEAIGTIPSVDLYIYGHTHADRCYESYREGKHISEIQVYHEKGYAPKMALGNVQARSGNLDSVAIREAASRMRKMTRCSNNLMFVITDGAPNENCQTLIDTVKRLEKEGMNIVAVCIEPHYDPSELYTHSIRFSNMDTLAIDLGKIIKKAILKKSNRCFE